MSESLVREGEEPEEAIAVRFGWLDPHRGDPMLDPEREELIVPETSSVGNASAFPVKH
jgi:hypothetical protein